jgi:ATP-dependent DNA ligase
VLSRTCSSREGATARTILDGEIVIADDDAMPDFGALQSRLAMSPRQLREMTSSCPAVVVAFDVLELAGSELLDQPLAERRRHLEALLRSAPLPAAR